MATVDLPSMVEVVCAHCGVTFTRRRAHYLSNEANGRLHYCTKRCANTANADPDAARERGLRRATTANGKNYPSYYGRRQHRVVAEQMLGRPLVKGEVVHHIDGNRLNNDPSNLQVLPSQAEHVKIHARHTGCSVDGCERKHAGHGLCGTHLKRIRDRERGIQPRKPANRSCCIDGCERTVHARDMCQTHARRVAREKRAA